MYANEVRIIKEKLDKPRQNFKREIKIEVNVENGGTITGNVKC